MSRQLAVLLTDEGLRWLQRLDNAERDRLFLPGGEWLDERVGIELLTVEEALQNLTEIAKQPPNEILAGLPFRGVEGGDDGSS